jgi:hypothetical protein
MYFILITLHSIFRWAVVISLLFAIYRGLRGWTGQHLFSPVDNTVRHVTATIAHIQLMLGYVLYFNSPLVAYFRAHYHDALKQLDFLFFGLLHIILMTISVIVITIGSSMAKRQSNDRDQFRTMATWFIIGLIIIFIAIPWPFSPLAKRPLLRTF